MWTDEDETDMRRKGKNGRILQQDIYRKRKLAEYAGYCQLLTGIVGRCLFVRIKMKSASPESTARLIRTIEC